jgi:hypothetical protein
MSKRDDYIEKMKLQLDEVNAKMGELEAKAKEAKADARAKYADEMAKLREQSQLALTKLDELKAAGEDSWTPWLPKWRRFATPSFIPSSTSSPRSKAN